MTKQTGYILVLLASCFLPTFAHGEECRPPADYKFSAYVFNERFSCKKEENKSIECGIWGSNAKDVDSGKAMNCDRGREISVLYANLDGSTFFNPIQEAKNEFNKNRSKRSTGWAQEIYKCPQKEIAMYVGYHLGTAYIDVGLYHPNSYSSLFLDSKLPYNLPTNSPLITQTTQALETYLCYSFDPKKFLDTLEAPPFSFPDRRTQQEEKKEEPTTTNKTSTPSTPTQFTAATFPVAKPLAQPKQPQKEPVSVPTTPVKNSNLHPQPQNPTPKEPAPAELPVPQSSKTDTFRLAEMVFQATYSPVQEVRHFQSANKLVDLKINFKTGDKSAFQEKLKRTFAGLRLKETLCPNQNILLEFVVDNSYRAFLLHPSAIVSWEEPLYANALSNLPSENQKRQELCALNPTQFWK